MISCSVSSPKRSAGQEFCATDRVVVGFTERKLRNRPGVFLKLFLAFLLLAALDESMETLLSRYTVLSPPLGSLPPGSYEQIVFSTSTLAVFLVNPVLLFIVFYCLDWRIDLTQSYLRVGASLFLGGLVGYSVPYFLLPVAIGTQWAWVFPRLLSMVATLVAFFIILARFGLDVLFPGFVAIAVANLRSRGRASGVGNHGGSSDEKMDSLQLV